MGGFCQTRLLPTLHECLCRLCLMSSGTELAAVVSGQHVHPIPCDFSWGCVEDKVHNITAPPPNARTKIKYSLGNCKYSHRTATKGKSEPLPPIREMSTCRRAAFSTLPVIGELQLRDSERYLPTGILVHRQNSYVPHSRRCTGRWEAQSREPVNNGKNLPVYYRSISPLSAM
jgi:hypothetical protein